jgi:hypothetical protein
MALLGPYRPERAIPFGSVRPYREDIRMDQGGHIPMLHRLSAAAVVVAAAALLALGWLTTALAQADGDGDGFDGDELLSLPIVLGVGLLAALGWLVYRQRADKPPSSGPR